ncbi:hypothetical protein HPP92_014559 [Vanilla planifolia]|uniref:Alpha-mannosidase n=1 Tax=Vanilla planifolia TaxID=51239 RepID=A0A835QUP3_VANPL|nr:hypothetical protein HPP92_014559 [Vanilla planifolia]
MLYLSAMLFISMLIADVGGSYIRHNTSAGVIEGKLNVHLVPHTHDDVGWLKTVDQYYSGSNNSIQGACVRNVLDSVVMALLKDPNRKFIYAEQFYNIVVNYVHQIGFDSIFFARIDYQERIKRKAEKSLEVIWRGSETFGSSAQIFASTFPGHYGPPRGFYFDVNEYDSPIQDDPLLYDYNVNERVDDFIIAALAQANVTRTNHIMWTMGDDFEYQYAESWFKQMDKLIHYVNKDGRVNALYSTPSIYADAKFAANESWPLKTDDYLPYANGPNAYFTGYYTSWPAFKRYVRVLSGYYLAARQLEFLVGRKNSGPSTSSLGQALGVAQHHDAVSGTSLKHTMNDYAKRLAQGASEAEIVINNAIPCLTNPGESCATNNSLIELSQCGLLNVSYCPATEELSNKKSLVIIVYNSLGWNRIEYAKIPVNDNQIVVRDADGNVVETQFIEIDSATMKMRNFYVKAYLGDFPKDSPKYWLVFQVLVPPLGWNTYFISKSTKKAEMNTNGNAATISMSTEDTVEIGSGYLKMFFSSTSGQLKRFLNERTGVDMHLQQSYLWYDSSPGDDQDSQASHAYIFRPSNAPPTIASKPAIVKVVRGPLVDEIHQQFNSWIYQVTRIYKDKENVEFDFTIGPVPSDGVGKEVFTQLTSDMVTNKTFYTDSNGRDFIKRVRNYREDWNLTVTQPIAGNYYPLNLGMYVIDGKHELSTLVDRACGGSSLQDGQLQIMLHRRILNVKGSFLGEALNETICIDDDCQGLTIRGSYYMNINPLGNGAQWRRTTGQEIYSPVLLAFTHEDEGSWKSSKITKATAMDPGYSLPPNVALITLEELDDGSVLLRLAHLFEDGEDQQNSVLATVELKKIFAGKVECSHAWFLIKEWKETSLSANQNKSEMKKRNWRVEGETGNHRAPVPVRGGPVNNSTLIVELGPMEIRTFLLKF